MSRPEAGPPPAAAGLAQIAARYVPGGGPLEIDALGSGLVNSSYRVRRDGKLFSLRIAAARGAELGLDRVWECRVLRCASDAGIAPAVECCEPDAGVLVTRWVEGRVWTATEAASPENLERVARLARQVHALPPPQDARALGPARWIAFYRRSRAAGGSESRAPRWGGEALEGQAQGLLEALDGEPATSPVLCHGDLHVHNLLVAGTGEPVLLDWEYAHVSEALWDLAGWASNSDLGAERRELLLGSYLGRQPTAAQVVRLARLTWLYDYVCLLWSELYLSSPPGGAAQAGAAEGVVARAGLLAERLECRAVDAEWLRRRSSGTLVGFGPETRRI